MSDELKKQAQQKLAEARRLIKEAGDLAEQGSFTLYFGEVGNYVPLSMLDKNAYRDEAAKAAKRDVDSTGGNWDELSLEEQENLIDDYLVDHMTDSIGYERLQMIRYGYKAEDVSGWWHPSRC